LLLFIAVMSVIVLVAVGLVAWIWRQPAPPRADTVVPARAADWIAVTTAGELQWHVNAQTRTLRTDVAVSAATLPVLSHDGTQVAYARINNQQLSLSVVTLATGTISDMYTATALTQTVSMVHWAPDGRHVGFVVDSNAVMVAPSDGATPAITIAHGAPAFLDWSPDGQNLLVRVGNLGRDGGMLGIYSVIDNHIHMTQTDVGDFQAARWDITGAGYYYVVDQTTTQDSQSPTHAVIRYQKLDGTYTDIASEGEATVRLLPAPDGASLAYIVSRKNERLVRIWRDGVVTTIADNQPLTAWWSPDARMLACLVAVDDTHLQWVLVDVLHGTRRTLSTFAPNDAMIDVLHYFDGTAYTPWSSDGQWLMTTSNGIVQAQAVTGGDLVPLGPGVYAQWVHTNLVP